MTTKSGPPVDVTLTGVEELRAKTGRYPNLHILVSDRPYDYLDQIEYAWAILGKEVVDDYEVPQEVLDRVFARKLQMREPGRYTDRDDYAWWVITDDLVCFDMEAAFVGQLFAIEIDDLGHWVEGKCVSWQRPSFPFIDREPELSIEAPKTGIVITARFGALRRVSLNWDHRTPKGGQ